MSHVWLRQVALPMRLDSMVGAAEKVQPLARIVISDESETDFKQ